MELGLELYEAPLATVRVLPTRTGALPFLFHALQDGHVVLSREALAWANALAQLSSLKNVEQSVAAIGRLHDWYMLAWAGRPLTQELLADLIYSYLHFRLSGTVEPNGRSIIDGIIWKPARYETVRADFNAIRSYIQFCATAYGYVNLASGQLRVEHGVVATMLAEKHRTQRDFFAHLAAHRERWKSYFDAALDMPRVGGAKRPIRTKNTFRQMMPLEEWAALIDAERNPVFRAIWMLSAFGGLRISEILNMWQVDVLPASYRSRLFGFDDETILVLRAHPSDSTYTTTVADRKLSRRQYLSLKYGRAPRPDSAWADRAGWKGTIFSNEDRLLLPVFWLDRRMADLFADCAGEINHFHKSNKTSASHPYLFINIAARGESAGEPQKISNVEAAFERACRRVGLEPHKNGRSIHGGRHLYKWIAKSLLGLTPDAIQLAMGHASVESQAAYGKSAKEAAEFIRKGQLLLESKRG